MGKRLFCLFLLLLCLFTLTAGAEETAPVLVNKILDKTSSFAFPADAKLLEIWFPEISGCDAALIKYGDYAALIDGATPQQADAVLRMLKKAGVTRLDYAVNSHPDPDHMGGFKTIFASVPAELVIVGFPKTGLKDEDNQKFNTMLYQWMEELNIPVTRLGDGDGIYFGGASFTMLQVYDEEIAGINNSSLMCMVSLAARSAFFTGDIQLDTQKKLVASGAPIRADILKFSHHGYRGADEEYLRAIAPEVCVLTGGFRSSEAARMQLSDMKLYFATTDRGILHFTTDGATWLLERIE